MHSTAFQLGPLTIGWYGIMVALGFLAGLWNAARRAPQAGIHAEKILDLGPWLIVSAILGARTLYVFTFWREQFATAPLLEIIAVWKGGLVYYGGLIGASLGCILYVKLKALPLWKIADIMAPSVALGYVFGRWGCFFNGCCYGNPATVPWGVCYPPGHDTHPVGGAAVPVHPTQIYESLLNLGLFGFLAWFFPRRKSDGQVFALYLIGYACTRSFIELFRGDYPQNQRFLSGALTPAHLVSAAIFITGVALFLVLRRAPPKQPA